MYSGAFFMWPILKGLTLRSPLIQLLDQHIHILRVGSFHAYALAIHQEKRQGVGVQGYPLNQRLLFGILFKIEFSLDVG